MTDNIKLPPISEDFRQLVHYNPNTDDIVTAVQELMREAVRLNAQATPAAPQPAQQNYLEMIYEYLCSTAPVGYADEAFRQVPEEVFAADSRNRISERRASLSQHTEQLPTAFGQEEVGRRQAGCAVTSIQPAQQPLTDEQMAKALGFGEYTVESTKATLTAVARAIEQAHGIGVKND